MTVANMSREVEVTAVSVLLLACAIKKRKRKKRIWMRDFLTKKNQGSFQTIFRELDDKSFTNYLRTNIQPKFDFP